MLQASILVFRKGYFMKQKRFLALLLSVVMIVLSSDMVLASNSAMSVEDMIIQQAILADDKTDWSNHDFAVVELQKESSGARSVDSAIKVLQTESTEGDVTTFSTLMPYKVMEGGELINSFEYAERTANSRSVNDYYDTFVDVVVATSVEYEVVGTRYYRHGGVNAYWGSTGNVSSIDRLLVSYRTYGVLYYWDGSLGTAVNGNATATEEKSEIDVSKPIKGKMYSVYDTTPSNQVFVFGGDDLGSAVSIQVNNELPQVYNIK